jgi:hypothetical protein
MVGIGAEVTHIPDAITICIILVRIRIGRTIIHGIINAI